MRTPNSIVHVFSNNTSKHPGKPPQLTAPGFLFILPTMYARFNNRRPRRTIGNGGPDDGGSIPHGGNCIPGYCACGRPAERNGKCGTCNHADRRSIRDGIKRASTKKPARIKSRSKKQSKLEAQYSVDRAAWLPGKKCAVFPSKPATEVHHMKGRRGYANAQKRLAGIPLLLDKDYWLPVSHDGHTEITNRSAWAIENGFTILRSKSE